ncbi:MAG: HAMP domain-containing sensor histidine kinase [Clostridium sp.]|uniref:sensor histidine kinase n=1 Tax=Clostridium sp. TaxID=1506 RepID=UPI0029080A30|nr:HAMP domain-containing sensor histidine kinase [Clostridium sp.]MDU7337903.1 HAMP domain-containing sensor histidine kinase [Clostridium sp.]
MKILVNRKIKSLFGWVLLLIVGFTLLSMAFIIFEIKNAALCILACSLLMSIMILIVIYRYFIEQNEIMETAVSQIKEYILGNKNARLACNDEGELYRLFHEVNALVAILNAHADNEGKSKKFLKDIISDISHQLKTPLAALNVYVGIIQEESKDLPTIQEFTSLSEQELDRIEILVQNLLKITKLDAGTITLEKANENVPDMMSSIEKHFSYRAKKEEKELLLFGNDTVTLLCDRNWFMEAISNIVKNAFDHTKKGNTIRIEWKQFASVVQIIITDNGSGIHTEDLYHIFKRFYRSHFSKDTQGVGLGLSLAKTIIEAHNGTIEVSSDLGFGSTFTINFLIPTK